MPRIWPKASLIVKPGTVMWLEKSAPVNGLPDLRKFVSHSPAEAAWARAIKVNALTVRIMVLGAVIKAAQSGVAPALEQVQVVPNAGFCM
jgi:hypothetical protein